jgi:hypothetical protein
MKLDKTITRDINMNTRILGQAKVDQGLRMLANANKLIKEGEEILGKINEEEVRKTETDRKG